MEEVKERMEINREEGEGVEEGKRKDAMEGKKDKVYAGPEYEEEAEHIKGVDINITINMLAKKFGLLGSRESEVFYILRARNERVKYGKPSSQAPKSLNFCKHVFNFLGFCHFPFYFLQFEF